MDFLKNCLIVTIFLEFCKPIALLLAILLFGVLLLFGFANMAGTLGASRTIATVFIFAIIPGLIFGYGFVLLQRKIGKWYYKIHPKQPRPAWWKNKYEA